MNQSLKDAILGFGFPVDRATLIHAFVGGSALHGVKLDGTDDTDIYGIFIERPEIALGLDRLEHFVTSTAAQEDRNNPTDVDITCYSLRKWAGLAARGNPTVLQFLFTPVVTRAEAGAPFRADFGDLEWSEILGARELFLAQRHCKQYMGYADAQLRRMTGERGRGKHGQRPELEVAHGYDTKAAMHTLRILHEGIELISDGWLTLPRTVEEREGLLAVRRGEKSVEWVIAEANRLFAQLREAVERSPLPESVDRRAVSDLVARLYRNAWNSNGI